MWMFITARLRSWLIFAIVLPVVTTAVHMVRERLEARSGRTRLVAALTMIENVGKRKARESAGWPAEVLDGTLTDLACVV
jgi:hypothetical protein